MDGQWRHGQWRVEVSVSLWSQNERLGQRATFGYAFGMASPIEFFCCCCWYVMNTHPCLFLLLISQLLNLHKHKHLCHDKVPTLSSGSATFGVGGFSRVFLDDITALMY